MRSLLLALVICLGLPLSVSARTEFEIYGARGDRGDTAECPAGSFMVGLSGRTGGWIDQIKVECGKQEADGSIGAPRPTAAFGGEGGEPQGAFCDKDAVATEFFTGRTPGYQIAFVALTCVNVRTSARVVKTFGPTRFENTNTQSCNASERATGLKVRFGRHVNGVGLICNDFRPVAVAPTPSPIAQICRDYGVRMAARDTVYAGLKCRGWAGERKTASAHERQCLGYGAKAAETIKYNEGPYEQIVAACKKEVAGGGGVTKTVALQVTVYDKPQNGRDLCYLRVNDKVTLLAGADIPQVFRNFPDKNWVAVRGNTGGCNGVVGGVYDDGKLK